MFIAIILGALLQVAHMEIRDVQLIVEIADTAISQEIGLMGRDSLPSDHGMLFVYNQPKTLSFWMKNTKIPLSIGFFDVNQNLTQIENMNPQPISTHPALLKRYESKSAVKYALEVPQNWFQDHGIVPGDHFTLTSQKETQ